MINLEVPKKFEVLVQQANQVATEVLRPISRKYDRAEHEYPAELDLVSAVIDGMSASGAAKGAGASSSTRATDDGAQEGEVAAATDQMGAHGGRLGPSAAPAAAPVHRPEEESRD